MEKEPLKFYLCGCWNRQDDIASKCADLESLGLRCTEKWFDGSHDSTSMEYDALMDIRGVEMADVVIAVMTEKDYAYRGTFTELGAALALKKIIIVLSLPEESQCKTNTFFRHIRGHHVTSWQSVLSILGARDKAKPRTQPPPYVLIE